MGVMITAKPPVTDAALRILRQLPSLDAVVTKDDEASLVIEYKPYLRGPEARIAAEQLRDRGNAIVVAKQSTIRAREILREAGIGVVDAAGNAHLDLPGLVVHIEQPRAPEPARQAPRMRGKAAVIVQAILLEPDRDWKVVDLAKRSGASLGSVHRVVASLEARELLAGEGAGRAKRRRVANPGALLDLLAEDLDNRGVERMPAYVFSQAPQDVSRMLSGRLQRQGIAHAVSGSAAANLLAPHLTSVPVAAVWIAAEQPLASAANAAEAEPADRGANVLFMQSNDDGGLAFREERDGVMLANVFRIYVDARHEPQRGPEQAEHLRREVIGF